MSEDEVKAATRIQATLRGRQTRKRLAQRPPAPPAHIKAPPRPPKASESKLCTEDEAAARIQAVLRGKRDRKLVREKRAAARPPRPAQAPAHVPRPAATSAPIPGVRRPSGGVPKLGVRLERQPSDVVIKDVPPPPSEDEHLAAAKMQALYRGKRDRARVRRMQPPKPPQPPAPKVDEDMAATKVQALFRGKKDRARVRAMRSQPPPPPKPPAVDPELDAKATKIQAVFRGRQARKALPPRPPKPQPKPEPQPEPEAKEAAPAHIPRPQSQFRMVPGPAPPVQRQQSERKVPPKHAGQLVKELEAYKEKNKALEAKVLSLTSQVDSYRRQMTEMTKNRRTIASLRRQNAELQEKLQDAFEDTNDQNQEVKAAEERVEQAQQEIRLLEQQIQKEVDDFETLRDTLQEKEDVVNQHVARIHQLETEAKNAGLERERLHGMIRVRDDRIKFLTPPTADAGCDAMPLDDSLAVRLRDEALAVKDSQIADLSAQNLRLMTNLDQLEGEVKSMQEDLTLSEFEVQKKKAEALNYKKESIRLTNIIKQAKGQEYAMDVAAKQNSQLLQLLEAAEKKVDEANDSREEAWAQVEDHRAKMLDAVRDAAQHEARAMAESRDSRQLAGQVAVLKTKLDTQVSALTKELREVKSEARVQVEAVQEELQTRRDKQYQLLDKLGKTEDSLRAQTARAEESIATARTLQQRVLELETQIMKVKAWRLEEAQTAATVKRDLEALVASLREKLERAEKERQDVKGQMMQMGQTVVNLAERQRVSETRTNNAEEETRSKQGEIAALKERIAHLMDQVMRHDRLRAELELDKTNAKTALREIQTQYAALAAKTQGGGFGGSSTPSFEQSMAGTSASSTFKGKAAGGSMTATDLGATRGSGWQGTGPVATSTTPGGLRDLEMQKQLRGLRSVLATIKDSKRRVVERAVYIHSAMVGAQEAAAEAAFVDKKELVRVTEGVKAAKALQMPPKPMQPPFELRGLGLVDEDVAVIVDVLSSPAPASPFSPPRKATDSLPTPEQPVQQRFAGIHRVDLRGNSITDSGAMVLAGLLAGATPLTAVGSRLAFIDLRGNHISPAGIRALAEALRSHKRLDIQHVYVGRTGLIQALGRAQGGDSVVVVACIDATDNSGDSDGNAGQAARQLRGTVRAARIGAGGGTATLQSYGATSPLRGGPADTSRGTTPLAATAPGTPLRGQSRLDTRPPLTATGELAAAATVAAVQRGEVLPGEGMEEGESTNRVRGGADISRGSKHSRSMPALGKQQRRDLTASAYGGSPDSNRRVNALLARAAGSEMSALQQAGSGAPNWSDGGTTKKKWASKTSKPATARHSVSSRGRSRSGTTTAKRASTPGGRSSKRRKAKKHKEQKRSQELPDVELSESQILPRLSMV